MSKPSLPVNLHCWFCSCVTRILTKLNQKPNSVTSFKIKVAYALKLAQRSTCSPRKNTSSNIGLDEDTRYASVLT